jgi:hypothetical protein
LEKVMSHSRPSRRLILTGSLAAAGAALASRARATTEVRPPANSPVVQRATRLLGDFSAAALANAEKIDALERVLILSDNHLSLAGAVASNGETSSEAATKLGGSLPALATQYIQACLIFRTQAQAMMNNGAESYNQQTLETLGDEMKDLNAAENILKAAGAREYAGKERDLDANTPENAAVLIQWIITYMVDAGVAPALLRTDPLEAQMRLRQTLVRTYKISDDVQALKRATPDIIGMSEIMAAQLPAIDRALTVGLSNDRTIQPQLIRALNDFLARDENVRQTLNAFP